MSHELGRILILNTSPKDRRCWCRYFVILVWGWLDVQMGQRTTTVSLIAGSSQTMFHHRTSPQIQRHVTDMKEEICFTNLSTFDSWPVAQGFPPKSQNGALRSVRSRVRTKKHSWDMLDLSSWFTFGSYTGASIFCMGDSNLYPPLWTAHYSCSLAVPPLLMDQAKTICSLYNALQLV